MAGGPRDTGFEEEWRERFERFSARGGDDAKVSGWSERGLVRRMEILDRAWRRARPDPGSLVLDLGCGPGAYAEWLVDRGFGVLAVDYAKGMLERALRVAGRPRVHLVRAEAYRTPFDDGAAHATITIGVFQHLADAPRAVREIARVTRPGGRLFLDTLNGLSVQGLFARLRERRRARKLGRDWRHAVRYRARALVVLLRSEGFDEISVRGVYIFPKWLRWLEPVFDGLDRVRLPGSARPLTLFVANAFLVSARRR